MSGPTNLESDATLLGRVSSDAGAFEEIYQRHVSGVTRFLARRCATPEDVADAVSATFLSILTSAGTYDESRGSSRAWILSIAGNAAKGQWRSVVRDQRLMDRVRGSRLMGPDDVERIAEMIDAERESAPVLQVVRAAPDSEREVVAHMVARDVGAADAARILGISHGAARTRLTRLRKRVNEPSNDADSLAATAATPVLRVPKKENMR